MGNVTGDLNKLANQGGNAMKSVGQGQAEISVMVSYILCVFCVLGGVALLIYSLIPTVQFNCNSDNEQAAFDFCSKGTDADCTTKEKELNDKKAKCLEKTRKFVPFGLVGIGIVLFGIVIVLLSRWNRTLVKNNPTVAATEGVITTANIIGDIFRHR